MNISLKPAALTLVGNMNHLKVSCNHKSGNSSPYEDISFTISKQGSSTPIVERVLSPDKNGFVEIDLFDIVYPELTFSFSNVSEPYRQNDIVKTFTIQLLGITTAETATWTFTAIRAGVDRLADSADNFLQQNFLTWQPNIKGVTYYSPEFLTYYASVASVVKCKARVGNNDVSLTLANISAGRAYTIPVGYAIIAGKVNGLPSYYDVWVEVSGTRVTYIQRYYAQDMKSENEQWILFENSLGGVDTFRAYGNLEMNADHSHNVAEIDETSTEFRVDTTRKFKKNTGRLDLKERRWLLDFFPSLKKYIYIGDYLRQIVVTDSDVNYKSSNLPSQYNFTYKYADAKPYLNLPRTDTPLEVLHIDVPEVGSFTVAPRLVEFPRTQLSSGALFPVQDPYSESWGATTLGAIVQYFVQYVLNNYSGGGGVGHTHSNLPLLERLQELLDEKLSKVRADIAKGHITFKKGLTAEDESIFKEKMLSDGFVSGMKGWLMDAHGNLEVETLYARNAIIADELRVNRQQAQEGDTIYSENDQIEEVEEYVDETDHSTYYILTLKEKWEGYFTAQMYGNVIRGKINTLAAKNAGVSDFTGDTTGQEHDSGQNLYYTSFMLVRGAHNTDPQLGVNQIRVVLYGDHDVPMSRNFPPCKMMVISRWGCEDYSDEYVDDPRYEFIKSDIKRRQQTFVLSTSDGRITKLTGVSKPILENGNIGATFGNLPEFVLNNPEVRRRHIEGRDYLYAQGVVVGDFIQTNVEGVAIPDIVFVGDWVDGSMIDNPTVGNGIYLCSEFNDFNQRYETHTVRHRNGTWKCMMHQPVTSGGITTYYEPKFNSPYWQLIDGNGNLSMEFISSRGDRFRVGYVNTVVTPHVYYGNVDITNDITVNNFRWERQVDGEPETDADRLWNSNHIGVKALTLGNLDMPVGWGIGKKVIFTCICSVNDGKNDMIVENQVIV